MRFARTIALVGALGSMPSWDGFGDWNVQWPQWTRGGLLLNH